jgi:hypothetical protein
VPLGRSCPLQTILLSDLAGCDSPLQIILAFWRTIIVIRELSHLTQKVWIQNKKGLPLLSAEGCHTRLDGQHCPLITYQGVFFKGGETLWWHKSRLFFRNKKGLTTKLKHLLKAYNATYEAGDRGARVRGLNCLGWFVQNYLWALNLGLSCRLSPVIS